MPRPLLTTMALLVASAATGQGWEVTSRLDETSGADRRQAIITQAEGHLLSVAADPAGGARCTLRLAEGSGSTFSSEHPPELRIDGGEPLRIVTWAPEKDPFDDGGDFMEAARRRLRGSPEISLTGSAVTFRCWRPLARQTSPTWGPLRQMMDGETLTFSFQPAEGGREEIVFPLGGASGAISEALGVTSKPSERDRLQDELLRLRIDYRSNTCFLLAGKKNLKRCLEAVNECARQPHDSAIDNLNCIEVE